MSKIGSVYKGFQRANEEARDDETQLFRREKNNPRTEEWEAILNPRLQRPGHARSASLASTISPLEEFQPKRRPGAQNRQHAVTPLSAVPPVYFEEDFHLENPRTFDVVSERSEILQDPGRNPDTAPSGRKALASNAILQEKLSWYLDTVEIHLITSISSASKSFFSALGSLRVLHADAADSVGRIQRLRKDLAKLDKEMAMGGLKVINLKKRRENVKKLGEAMDQLREVVLSVARCDDLVENGDIDAAMDNLDDVEKLMAGVPNGRQQEMVDQQQDILPLRDLRGIKALSDTQEDLNHLRDRIGTGYEARFLGSLLGDVRRHIDNVPPEDTLRRWMAAFTRLRVGPRRTPSAFPAYMSLEPSFRSELHAELSGLSRARHTMPAATAFRAAVFRELKELIRKHLPSSTEDDSESIMSASTAGGRRRSKQEKSSVLARNLRALDPDDTLSMLTRIYTGISEALRRLSVQVKIMLDITSGLGRPGATNGVRSLPRSPSLRKIEGRRSPRPRMPSPTVSSSSVLAELQQALDMSSLLGEAVDIVQAQMTKIVKVRSEQTARMPLQDFLRFFSLNRLFADECEAVSGRSGSSLKNVVDNQIRDFVTQFGNAQRQRIIEVMDSDKWDAKDFGESDSMLLDRVLGGSTTDAPSWTSSWDTTTGDEPMTNGVTPHGTGSSAIGKDKVRSAVIEEQKFILPESAMTMLRSVENFLHLTAGIPSMAPEITNSLLECFKLFNSRSSQLILGAGATRSAGLKNITAKHLSLSSQALSFIVALIPYIREFFRRHLTTSGGTQVMSDFDKVKRLLQEHQYGIHEKLVEIMSSRATVSVNAMKRIDWEEAKTPSVNGYVETLIKETGTLQKVLAKHLPASSVTMIMQPVFQSYKEQWSKAYSEVALRSAAAKERYI